ncbi:MAG: hypothetical protein ACPLRW_07785 [Moorellales bacterium]
MGKRSAVEELSQVDPGSGSLDDLGAWGEVMARRGGLARERSKQLLKLVREIVSEEG